MPKRSKNNRNRGPGRRRGKGANGAASKQVANAIPRTLVPDALVLHHTENRIDLTVTANTAYSKWIAFLAGGYRYQDGAAGAPADNSWTGDYWTSVVEKAADYYSIAELVELKVNMIAPAQHVAG